jgi:hypothetical protein
MNEFTRISLQIATLEAIKEKYKDDIETINKLIKSAVSEGKTYDAYLS